MNPDPDYVRWRRKRRAELTVNGDGLACVSYEISAAAHGADRIYAEYDREFRTFLAKANGRVGKEAIKVESLSDQFTVRQKLAIKGTPNA